MKLRSIKPFKVVGVASKTDLWTERESAEPKQSGLWSRLLDRGRMFQIPHRVNRIEYLTLFTEYEAGDRASFSLIVGQRVFATSFVPDGLTCFAFPGGDYLVFHARGRKPETLDEAYEEVARSFGDKTEWKRAWTTDFEVSGIVPDQTDLYISVSRERQVGS